MKNRNKFLLSSITLAVFAMMDQASAQQASTDTSAAPAPQRVEITGSSIRRVDAEEALPVTIIKADEFVKRGYTTVADVLESLSVGQSSIQGSVAAGTIANFRGLGLNRTLVLLDGQRVANEPTEDGYVNIDVIPISALDRVEVLRDGASSTYGSDAMAGVLNFITKRSYNGVQVSVQGVSPDQSGGANEQRFSIIGGKGNLETDGWDLYGTLDIHDRGALPLSARPQINGPAYLNTLFPPATTGTGGYAFPANITGIVNPTTGKVTSSTANPSGTSCAPPFSLVAAKGSCISNDTSEYGVAQPEVDQASAFVKGNLKLSADNTLTAQVMVAQVGFNSGKSAAATSKGFAAYPGGAAAPIMTITTASPYYPGAGITPAVAGTGGNPLQVEWEANQLGAAYFRDLQKNARILLTDAGSFHNWDFKVNADMGGSDRADHATNGYFNNTLMNTAVQSGINGVFINPFGAQSPAGLALMNSLSESGAELRDTHDAYDSLNFTANHDLMELPGGTMALSVGGDYHYDEMRDVSPPNNINISYNGRLPYNVHAARDVAALFAEVDMPITKQLDTDVSLRDDEYYTQGTSIGSSVKPKATFRYQPTKTFLVRGSYNQGFHAPTLIDQYGYSLPFATTTTSTAFNDPLLCPGGVANTALLNYISEVSSTACNAKSSERTGANPALRPETSEGATLGIVFEPVRNVTVAVDYWRVHMTNSISSPSISALAANPALFAADFVRLNNGPNGSPGTLSYVNDINENLGDTATNGFDLSAAYTSPLTSTGRYAVKLDGTYVNSYQFQIAQNGSWCQNVGQFGCSGGLSIAPVSSIPVMTFRWKDTLTMAWNKGVWGSQLTDGFQTGYHDTAPAATAQVAPYNQHTVPSYNLVNWTGSYTGIRNTTIMAGINNLFDRMPPASNNPSDGYLSNYANAIGRAYVLSLTYKFF